MSTKALSYFRSWAGARSAILHCWYYFLQGANRKCLITTPPQPFILESTRYPWWWQQAGMSVMLISELRLDSTAHQCYSFYSKTFFHRCIAAVTALFAEKQKHAMTLPSPCFTTAMELFVQTLLSPNMKSWRAAFWPEGFCRRCRNRNDCSSLLYCSPWNCCFQVILQLLSSGRRLLSHLPYR